MALSVYCIVLLFYCMFVMSPGPTHISHTPVAQHSLFVLNVLLNTSQPTIHPVYSLHSYLTECIDADCSTERLRSW